MIIIAIVLATIGSPIAALVAYEIRCRRKEAEQLKWTNEQFARIREFLDQAEVETARA